MGGNPSIEAPNYAHDNRIAEDSDTSQDELQRHVGCFLNPITSYTDTDCDCDSDIDNCLSMLTKLAHDSVLCSICEMLSIDTNLESSARSVQCMLLANK